MKKMIKRIGNSIGIIYTYEDTKIYSLKVGDVIEISEPVKVSDD